MNNSDMPIAFVDADDADFVEQCRPVRGLTKREYFAGLAMQAQIMARPKIDYDDCAEEAVLHAEWLLAELEKGHIQ